MKEWICEQFPHICHGGVLFLNPFSLSAFHPLLIPQPSDPCGHNLIEEGSRPQKLTEFGSFYVTSLVWNVEDDDGEKWKINLFCRKPNSLVLPMSVPLINCVPKSGVNMIWQFLCHRSMKARSKFETYPKKNYTPRVKLIRTSLTYLIIPVSQLYRPTTGPRRNMRRPE